MSKPPRRGWFAPAQYRRTSSVFAGGRGLESARRAEISQSCPWLRRVAWKVWDCVQLCLPARFRFGSLAGAAWGGIGSCLGWCAAEGGGCGEGLQDVERARVRGRLEVRRRTCPLGVAFVGGIFWTRWSMSVLEYTLVARFRGRRRMAGLDAPKCAFMRCSLGILARIFSREQISGKMQSTKSRGANPEPGFKLFLAPNNRLWDDMDARCARW